MGISKRIMASYREPFHAWIGWSSCLPFEACSGESHWDLVYQIDPISSLEPCENSRGIHPLHTSTPGDLLMGQKIISRTAEE